MAERKAVNKYYPPDWDPRKGSVNKRIGQHPLRDRAKKLSQGILVIRFELPYNIWCGGCGSHVGMGVRYNAEKSKVGNYYTTPIYKFRMKCHLCDNYFEIQTDPKNHDYVILSGARRKEQRWDPVANEQIVPEDKATQKKMAMDAMYKLEHGTDDQVKGKEKIKNLSELESSRYSMKDDYLLNRMARDKFRGEKKQLKEAADANKAILERGALDIELLEETEEDRNLAGLLKYSVTSSYEEKQKEKRKSIEKRPIFGSQKALSSATLSTPSSSSTQSSDSQNSLEETKQKLSENLRLAQKDPFSIGNPVKLFQSSTTKPSCLGIRLKGSKVLKRNVKKSSTLKKSLLSHIKADSLTSATKPSNQMKSRLFSGELTENNLKLSTAAINQEGWSSNLTKEKEFIAKFNSNSKDQPTASSSPEDCSSEKVHLPIVDTSTSGPSNSLSTSGLSMLMSNYDEDKDSDDSNSNIG